MPAEITPELYRMSMWQVDRWCHRNPWIDQDDVVSAVHERLTVALSKYDESKGAKFTTWLAKATLHGIIDAAKRASRAKRQAIKFSEIETDEMPIDIAINLKVEPKAEWKTIISDILCKKLGYLIKSQKEALYDIYFLGKNTEDYESRSKYVMASHRAKRAISILSDDLFEETNSIRKHQDEKLTVRRRASCKIKWCVYCGKIFGDVDKRGNVIDKFYRRKTCSMLCRNRMNNDMRRKK